VTEALNHYMPASGAQYTSGLAFTWARQRLTDRLIRPCLAAVGLPKPALETQADYVASVPSNGQFPDLAQRLRTLTMTGPARVHFLVKPTPANSSRAYFDAAARCTTRYAAGFARLDRAAAPLERTWLAIIMRIQSSPRVLATQPAFRSCLETNGIPARYASWDSANPPSNPLFLGFFAWADTFGQTGPTLSQERSWNHRWVPVFVTCARPAVTVLERIQLAHRAAFLARHAKQVRAVKELVTDLFARSARP